MQQNFIETLTNAGSLKRRDFYRKACLASFASLFVFALFFVLAPTLALEASATSTVSTAVSWDVISLTLNPGGDIDFGEVVPSSRDTSIGNYGTQKVAKKNVTITTNGDYYAVYLSTVGSSNALRTSSDTVQAIPPIGNRTTSTESSTFATTAWGFTVPTSETASTFSAYDDFLVSSTDAQANNLTKLGTGSSVYNTGLWSAVPTLANVSQIYQQSTNVATGFASGDSFPIYYSIMVDTDTLSGTYENQVVYTAIARAGRGDVSYNVTRDKDTATSYPGELETLRIDLAAANSNSVPTLTTSDLEIRLVPHSVITANNYSVASLVTTDYPACSPMGITSSGQSAEINCNLPLIGAKGSTDTSGNYTVADSSTYDFWVKVTLPDSSTVDYVSHYKEDTIDIASITYKTGLQSKNTSGSFLVTEMQQMTGNICQATNMWGTGTGDNAQIYDYRGEDEGTALLSAGTDSDGTSSFLLTDTRDSKTYKVRRLADGNCWMVQNLGLDLTTIGALSSVNTDLNSKTSWTPDQNTIGTSYDNSGAAKTTEHNWDYADGSSVVSDTSFNSSHASLYIGNHYNWYAATAESGTTSMSNVYADDSICAKGWKLPTVTVFDTLLYNVYELARDSTFSIIIAETLPTSLVRSGESYNNHVFAQLGNGGYWFTSHASANYNYGDRLCIDYNMSTFKTNTGQRAYGYSIRCVARD